MSRGLAELLGEASPAAFEVAAALDAGGRAALADELRVWLGGARQATRLPLLAWIDESDWPDLVALATAAKRDAREIVRDRATGILEEAARQVPDLVGLSPPRPTSHLALAPGYVNWRHPHPTQVTAQQDAPRWRFGGAAAGECGFCHEPLHHLLAHRGIELATCLSCVGWEQPLGDYALSYHHDERGAPHPLDRLSAPLAPEFPSRPLLETSVALVDAGPRFWSQDWAAAASRGANLHRLGGEPTWVQDADVRPCRDCGSPMEVVLQLDSGLPQVDGRTFAFGSGGVMFVQLCVPCRVSTALWQCT